MEYNFERSEQELKELRVFTDDELNGDDDHLGDTLANEMDYIGRKLTTNTSVPCNIHRDKYLDYWKNELEAPPWVIDQLVNGYSLPFVSEPPEFWEE